MSLQDKLKQFAETAEKAAQDAVRKAGDLAHDKRDTVTSGLDKVAAKVDTKTEGKYADKVAKAKQQITKGVDRLADQRHLSETEAGAEPAPPTAPPTTPPPTTPPSGATPPSEPSAASTLHEPPER